jgi:hypothetical protein
MRYRLDGEDYHTVAGLVIVLRKKHPGAIDCFIEGESLVVRLSGDPVPNMRGEWTEVRYSKRRVSNDLVIIETESPS